MKDLKYYIQKINKKYNIYEPQICDDGILSCKKWMIIKIVVISWIIFVFIYHFLY